MQEQAAAHSAARTTRRRSRGSGFLGPRAGACLALLGSLVAAGCSREPATRHVVLVSIDTLRANHLGLYGYARPTSPFIDGLAAESVVFDHAAPTSPSTAPSIASLLTGLHRASHGVRGNGGTLPEYATTLAETLRANGYRTVGVITVLLSTGMALPPVVVGLALYLLFSRAGPLGAHELLFTPSAMVIAQALLVLPIIASLTRQTIEDLAREYDEQLRAFGATRLRAAATLLFEARYSLPTALLAGLGRAVAEVGAVMIVGGNIAHVTRTMTTAIVLHSNRGDTALALALGLILVALAVLVNGSIEGLRAAARRAGA